MKNFCIFLLILLSKTALCQNVLENYDQFGGTVTRGQEASAFALADKILPEVSSLTERQRAIFYYKLAGLHEGKQQNEKAVDFYERSLKLVPDFYVPHLALGYLYLGYVNQQVQHLKQGKSNPLYGEYKTRYDAYLKKALSHLEKAMACDPNEEALAIIKNGYQTLKDPASLNSLDARLKELAKSCMSVLAED